MGIRHIAFQTQNKKKKSVSSFFARGKMICTKKHNHLTVSAELEHLSLLPGTIDGRSLLVGGLSAAEETTGLAASHGHTTVLAVLVHRVADPAGMRIVSDGLVEGVHHDDLVPSVDGIVGHPVGVEDTEGSELAASALLSDGTKVASSLHGGDTGRGGLTVADTLLDLSLATTSLDADAVHDESLLGLVSQATSFVGTARTGGTVHGRELAVFPSANTGEEAHDISLLLLPELFHIFIGTHFVCVL